jgi:hypothetical protein
MPKRPAVAALLALALSGCGLLKDAQNLVLGEPGTLKLLLNAPPTATATLEVSGSGVLETYRDDGRGFTSSLELRPGAYTVSAQPLEGYTAVVRLSEASGNSSLSSPAEVRVSSRTVSTVSVTYAPNP